MREFRSAAKRKQQKARRFVALPCCGETHPRCSRIVVRYHADEAPVVRAHDVVAAVLGGQLGNAFAIGTAAVEVVIGVDGNNVLVLAQRRAPVATAAPAAVVRIAAPADGTLGAVLLIVAG